MIDIPELNGVLEEAVMLKMSKTVCDFEGLKNFYAKVQHA